LDIYFMVIQYVGPAICLNILYYYEKAK
jgi:hypothetical protein